MQSENRVKKRKGVRWLSPVNFFFTPHFIHFCWENIYFYFLSNSNHKWKIESGCYVQCWCGVVIMKHRVRRRGGKGRLTALLKEQTSNFKFKHKSTEPENFLYLMLLFFIVVVIFFFFVIVNNATDFRNKLKFKKKNCLLFGLWSKHIKLTQTHSKQKKNKFTT